MQPSRAATELVRRWARLALQAESGRRPARLLPVGVGRDDIVAAVDRHRVTELLAAHAAAIGLPEAIGAELDRLCAAGRPFVSAGILELGEIADLLRQSGIPWLSLNGPALPMQSAGDAVTRGCRDLDVFVAPESVPEVAALLRTNGWTQRSKAVTAPSARRLRLPSRHGMTFDGRENSVHLRWRLGPTHSALPDFAAAWGRREAHELDGIRLETLGRADALAHACHDAARDAWRCLRGLVDVHRLVRLAPTLRTSRLDVVTLAITDRCVGLPAGLPPALGERIRAVPERAVRRAVQAQHSPLPRRQTRGTVRYPVPAERAAGEAARRPTLELSRDRTSATGVG